MKLPRHNCSLSIVHNEHLDYYSTVEDEINQLYPSEYFVSEEDMQLCIDTNECWTVRWYPDTPIGFYAVCGYDLWNILDYIHTCWEGGFEYRKE